MVCFCEKSALVQMGSSLGWQWMVPAGNALYAVMCGYCRAAKGLVPSLQGGSPAPFLVHCRAALATSCCKPQTVQQPCPINALKPTALP